MTDTLKDRVREKLLRQRDEDTGRPTGGGGDDQRVTSIDEDLALLDLAGDDTEIVERLARKYWVP
ncbi:hypothetical protein [Rhodococcus sp. HNM0569]|uniref:hypothetical protein n=1 Tax=Rhodococcus sp. HNM0569 TaxID=2716340 RepID=UPI00146EED98|nr:hypothetical protein [Rhodococcus sp. HNM0569]NLU83350.1 hypothetical protein [Rhodococcus sp. HNM0569]